MSNIPEQAVEAAITLAMSWHPSENGPSYTETRAEVKRQLTAALPLLGVQRPEDVARAPTISPSDPLVTIAGIRQFGLASDGSDLRDLEAAFTRLALPPQEGWQYRGEPLTASDPDWVAEATEPPTSQFYMTAQGAATMGLTVKTCRGPQRAKFKDWIVRVAGEIYLLTPEAYHALSAAPASPRVE